MKVTISKLYFVLLILYFEMGQGGISAAVLAFSGSYNELQPWLQLFCDACGVITKMQSSIAIWN